MVGLLCSILLDKNAVPGRIIKRECPETLPKELFH